MNKSRGSRSKSKSKKDIEEYNRKISEMSEIKLENENLKSELKVQQNKIVELEEKLEAKKNSLKIVSCYYKV